MNPQRSEEYAELRELIERSLNGVATEADVAELERRMADDADARRFYLDYMLVDLGLHWEQGALADLSEPYFAAPDEAVEVEAEPVVAARPVIGRVAPARRGKPMWAAAVAAALLIAGIGAAVYQFAGGDGAGNVNESARLPVAVLMDSAEVQWLSEPIQVGASVTPQTLRIESGRLTIGFHDGSEVTLRGPAEFHIERENGGRLALGHLDADAAPGFTLETPFGVRIVDLGTAFTVSVYGSGSTRVAVREGAVRVVDQSGAERRLNAGGDQRLVSGLFLDASFDPDAAYAAAVMEDEPVAYWPMTGIEGGKLADATGRFPLSPGGEHEVEFDVALGGSVIRFGENGELSMNAPQHGAFHAAAFTVEGWLHPREMIEPGLLMLAEPGNHSSGWSLLYEPDHVGGHLMLERYGAQTLRFTDAHLPRGVWSHVALVCEAEAATVYLNGRPVQTIAYDADAPTLAPQLYVKLAGRSAGGDFAGSLARFAYYDKPLTAERIARHYAARQEP